MRASHVIDHTRQVEIVKQGVWVKIYIDDMAKPNRVLSDKNFLALDADDMAKRLHASRVN